MGPLVEQTLVLAVFRGGQAALDELARLGRGTAAELAEIRDALPGTEAVERLVGSGHGKPLSHAHSTSGPALKHGPGFDPAHPTAEQGNDYDRRVAAALRNNFPAAVAARSVIDASPGLLVHVQMPMGDYRTVSGQGCALHDLAVPARPVTAAVRRRNCYAGASCMLHDAMMAALAAAMGRPALNVSALTWRSIDHEQSQASAAHRAAQP